MTLAVSRRFTLVAVLGLAGGVSAAPTATGPVPAGDPVPTPAPALQPWRASRLLDTPISGPGGHTLGRVWELIIGDSGSIIVLMQSRERGLVGVPLERLLLVPDTTRRDVPGHFVLQVSPEELLASPTLVSAEAVDRDWFLRIQNHYADAVHPASTALTATLAAAPASPADDVSSPPLRLRRLTGRPVVGEDERQAGRVVDLAIDVARARVSYLIVAVDSLTGSQRRRLHGIPWSHVTPNPTRDRQGPALRLAVARRQLERAPGLTLAPLPRRPDVSIAAALEARAR